MPTFEREQCLKVVDAGVSMLHVDYSIPYEDAERTPDELQDSRRFQFFALCRDQHPALDPLPSWIDGDDAERALDAGAIEELPASENILEEHGDLGQLRAGAQQEAHSDYL